MKQIIITLFLSACSIFASGQGCSDAGFCSIGSLAHQTETHQRNTKHQIKLILPTGLGDDKVFVFTPGVEYAFTSLNWQLAAKVTGNYASGNLGSAAGTGDVFLSASYQLPSNAKWKTALTLGTKLPLNQSNLKADGRSLPLQYQSSLGTIDLIAGVAVSSEKWKVAAGWQQPLSGINRNNFLPEYWPGRQSDVYPPSNDFNRKGDVLLRTSYRLLKSNKWIVETGLLGIYHLGEDTYINANVSKMPVAIRGSQGLTLNFTGSVELALNDRFSLGVLGGVPLIVRDVRPDGLTRSFVIAPQLTYQF